MTFGTKVIPAKNGVRMEFWIRNGSTEKLTGLNVQSVVVAVIGAVIVVAVYRALVGRRAVA